MTSIPETDMTRHAHTPGPWTLGPLDPCGVLRPDGRSIAWCSAYPEEQAHADARLIAAAPELLQAARDFVSWGTGAGYRFESGSPLDRARDAIDKAEGRT